MILPTAFAACLTAAAAHYGVAPERLQSAVAETASHPSKGRIGISGIPAQWAPYLAEYGFNASALATDDCENVTAGAWILAYTDRLALAKRRWADKGQAMPAKALTWQPAVRWISAKAGMSPVLVNALIQQESGFNADALGPRTKSGERAVGLMQIMPSTARKMGINPYDPMQNLWGGIWYLSNLDRAFGGNAALALAAYNAGPSAVARYGGIPPYRETMRYVPSIMRRAARYAQAE